MGCSTPCTLSHSFDFDLFVFPIISATSPSAASAHNIFVCRPARANPSPRVTLDGTRRHRESKEEGRKAYRVTICVPDLSPYLSITRTASRGDDTQNLARHYQPKKRSQKRQKKQGNTNRGTADNSTPVLCHGWTCWRLVGGWGTTWSSLSVLCFATYTVFTTTTTTTPASGGCGPVVGCEMHTGNS